MYRFFNQHLELGHDGANPAALAERDFRPLSREELTVWRGGYERCRPTPSEEAELGIVRALAADTSVRRLPSISISSSSSSSSLAGLSSCESWLAITTALSCPSCSHRRHS